jgi:predicted transcriptional regulator
MRLGRRELEILHVVWELREATVQDVCDRLARPAAYSTILTMMRTMESKGVLSHRVVGRTFVYSAKVSCEHVRASTLHMIRDSLFGGSAALLVSNMLSQSPMSEEDLAELRLLLHRRLDPENPHA